MNPSDSFLLFSSSIHGAVWGIYSKKQTESTTFGMYQYFEFLSPGEQGRENTNVLSPVVNALKEVFPCIHVIKHSFNCPKYYFPVLCVDVSWRLSGFV